MFEHLKEFDYIIVSGMQRTGTTIAARMIQYDTEIPRCIWLGHNVNRVGESDDPTVYHAPGLSHMLHLIETPPEVKWAVVWMTRDDKEVFDSLSRLIKWNATLSLEQYGEEPTGDWKKDVRRLIQIKAEWWEDQKSQIPNAFEIEYNSLKDHLMWVNKRDRKKFNARQTSAGSPYRDLEHADMVANDAGGSLADLLIEFPKPKKKRKPGEWTPPWE